VGKLWEVSVWIALEKMGVAPMPPATYRPTLPSPLLEIRSAACLLLNRSLPVSLNNALWPFHF
jgi:hypothetical protein